MTTEFNFRVLYVGSHIALPAAKESECNTSVGFYRRCKL